MNARAIVPLAVVSLLSLACAAAPREAQPAPTRPPAASAATSTPPATAPPAAAPAAVRIAHQPSTVSIGYYLATERGYFRQEGIEPDLISFSNASEMIPALATDQVETATVGGNPAMWNAAARGVPLKLIADQGTFRPGHGTTARLRRWSRPWS
jgi:ABC-type nitrate/sulfonate/bicarbonate transport system substrate-binding protein